MYKEASKDAIEVRDPISLDELIKKEFSLVMDCNLSPEEIIERGGNFFKKVRINPKEFPFPSKRKGKKFKIIFKIFAGIYHRDILVVMENEEFFGANVYEGSYFSKQFPKIQHSISFFASSQRKPGYEKGQVFAPCFSVDSFGRKTLLLRNINVNDKKAKDEVKEKIYLLGVKIVEVIE